MGILILVALLKVLCNIFDTARTILTQRNRAILSAIALTLTALTSNIVIKFIADADGWGTIIVASIASGLGCLMAVDFADKFFKEIGVRILLSDEKEVMQDFRDYLAERHITNIAVDSYKHGSWEEKSITIIAVPNTREKNNMIDEYAKSLKEHGTKVKIV